MATLAEILQSVQTPARNRTAAPGLFAPADESPLAALFQSIMSGGPGQMPGPVEPQIDNGAWMPPPQPPLPMMGWQGPTPGVPTSPIAPWIDLRAQRPPQQPMANFDLFGGIGNLLSGMTSGDAAAVPGAVPAAIPPGRTPVGTGMFEQQTPAGQAVTANFADFLSNLFPPVQSGVPAGGLRPDAPLPTTREAGAPQAQGGGQKAGAGGAEGSPFAYAWPGAGTQTGGIRSVTIPGSSGSGAAAEILPDYMRSMYAAESGGKMIPNAAGASSAFGPAQFTDGTWKATVQRHDPETFKARKGNVLDLREDAKYHDRMALNFTLDNVKRLEDNKLPVTKGNLYAMHFFGEGDGPKVLKAAPDTPLEGLVDAASIKANPHLKGKTAAWAQQWAENTINKQSGGSGRPALPALTSGDMPLPPTLQAPVGVDLGPVAALMAQLKPTQVAPMATSDRITTVLAQMAAGTAGAKNIGDLVAGAGAGAAAGAASNIKQARGDSQKNQEAQQDWIKTQANFGMTTAEVGARNKNAQIDVANKNAANMYERNVNVANTQASVRNKLEEIQFDLNMAEFKEGKPQFTVSKEGIAVVYKKPDGGADIKYVPLGEGGASKDADTLKDLKAAGLDESTQAQLLRYKNFSSDPLGLRREMLRDAVESGMHKEILGSQYGAIEKTVNAGLTQLDPKDRGKQLNERWLNVMTTMLTGGQLRDENWIPMMAKAGNVGARILTSNGQR